MANKTFLDYSSASPLSVDDVLLVVTDVASGSPLTHSATVQQILDNVPEPADPFVVVAGSGIDVNTSGSTVTVSSTVSASSIAPSTVNYIVSSVDSVLTNEKLITAGSNIEIDTSGSQAIIHSTASGGIDVTSGSTTINNATEIEFVGADVSGIDSGSAVVTITGGGASGKLQAYKNAGDQAISANTWTPVTLDSETVDSLGQWNTTTSYFTASSDGLYLITFSCSLNHGSSQDNKIVSTRVNGSLLGVAGAATIVNNTPGACQYYDAIATIQLPLYSGDSFQFEVYCGVATTVRNTISRTHAEVVKLCD